MARIWREGQPDAVWIYRFMSTGTLEEKIYQRQLRKQGLSRSIVDAYVHGRSQFSADELKSVFALNNQTLCETHDLIGCECCGGGKLMVKVANKKRLKNFGGGGGGGEGGEDNSLMMLTDSANFRHYDTAKNCSDPLLKELVTESSSLNDTVTFIFESKTRSVEEYHASCNKDPAPAGDVENDATAAENEEEEGLFAYDEALPKKHASAVITSDEEEEEEDDDFLPSKSSSEKDAAVLASDSELDMSIVHSDCESDAVVSQPSTEVDATVTAVSPLPEESSDSEPDMSFMQSDNEEEGEAEGEGGGEGEGDAEDATMEEVEDTAMEEASDSEPYMGLLEVVAMSDE